MSELLIGLTIVAMGTSLPEVAASVLASWRGERDIAVGNVIGSNLFNILCVLGLSAAVSAQGVAVPVSALRFDIPVMIAVAVVCLPIFFTGQQIARWEGGLFLGYYVAYTLYLVLSRDAADHVTHVWRGHVGSRDSVDCHHPAIQFLASLLQPAHLIENRSCPPVILDPVSAGGAIERSFVRRVRG